jgi:hypothetical protein
VRPSAYYRDQTRTDLHEEGSVLLAAVAFAGALAGPAQADVVTYTGESLVDATNWHISTNWRDQNNSHVVPTSADDAVIERLLSEADARVRLAVSPLLRAAVIVRWRRTAQHALRAGIGGSDGKGVDLVIDEARATFVVGWTTSTASTVPIAVEPARRMSGLGQLRRESRPWHGTTPTTLSRAGFAPRARPRNGIGTRGGGYFRLQRRSLRPRRQRGPKWRQPTFA